MHLFSNEHAFAVRRSQQYFTFPLQEVKTGLLQICINGINIMNPMLCESYIDKVHFLKYYYVVNNELNMRNQSLNARWTINLLTSGCVNGRELKKYFPIY